MTLGPSVACILPQAWMCCITLGSTGGPAVARSANLHSLTRKLCNSHISGQEYSPAREDLRSGVDPRRYCYKSSVGVYPGNRCVIVCGLLGVYWVCTHQNLYHHL